MHNEPINLSIDDFGKLTAREIDEWFVKVSEDRRDRYEKRSGVKDFEGFEISPKDKVIEDPMTEEGTLFLLSALGVNGVPKPKGTE